MKRRAGGALTASVAALFIFLFALAIATPASAAHLAVGSSRVVIDTAARCTAASVGTTAPAASTTSTTLRITGVPASCVGRAVTVSIVGTNNQVIATGSLATSALGTNNVTVSSYNTANVARVAVFFSTWWIDNTWTAPAAAPFASNCIVFSQLSGVSGPCTVTVSSISGIQNSSQGSYQELQVSVTHSVQQPMYWTADFNFAATPGLLVSPTKLGADWLNTSAPQGCGGFPTVRLRGADYQFGPSWYIGEYPTWRVNICG